MHQLPLTVLTVQQVAAGLWWGLAGYPEELDQAEHAAKLAQEEADYALGKPRSPAAAQHEAPSKPASRLCARSQTTQAA